MGFIGAAAGAAAVIGALIEDWFGGGSPAEEGYEQLPMELSWDDGLDGRLLWLHPGFPTDGVDTFGVFLLDDIDGSDLRAVPEMAGDDGGFLAVTRPLTSDGIAPCFIPWGAVEFVAGDQVTVMVMASSGSESLGVSYFEVGWQEPRPYAVAYHWRPVIALARLVAQADSMMTVSEAAERVRDGLEIPQSDKAFNEVWQEAAGADLEEMCAEFTLRFPLLDEDALLTLLSDVAKIDGTPGPKCVEVLRFVALDLGLDEADWPEFAAEMGLVNSGADLLQESYRVLQIHPGASFQQVRTAYRAAVKSYHPDLVANLPAEFQALAKQKTQEINEAYRIVLEDLKKSA